MKHIKEYVKQIKDELHGAKCYAEKYLYEKSEGNVVRAKKYQDMATAELSHAMTIHEMAVEDIKKLRETYTPTKKMLAKWEMCHADFIDCTAYVKQLLAM